MAVLVTYFSAGGNTRKVAEAIAKNLPADIFEIKPVKPYTDSDINMDEGWIKFKRFMLDIAGFRFLTGCIGTPCRTGCVMRSKSI